MSNRRHILWAAIIVACLLPLAVYAQDASQISADSIEYLVVGDSANLRSGPGTNFAIVGKVSKGDSIFIYDEPTEGGWLRVYQEGSSDAYIAEYLAERAPVRFYPADQTALFEVSGHGKQISDVFELPQGAYRIDATVSDNAFILKSVVIEGNCRDEVIFNEMDFDANHMTISALLISQGCSLIFESDNVDGDWQFDVRDIIVNAEFLAKNILQIEDGTQISGVGRSLTMATLLPGGIWTISAVAEDNAFILHSRVLSGDCDETSVFNEIDMDTKRLEISTVYRSPDRGCIVFWEASNTEKSWQIAFTKLR